MKNRRHCTNQNEFKRFGGAREQIIKSEIVSRRRPSKISELFFFKLGLRERPRPKISIVGLLQKRIVNYRIIIEMILLSIKDPLV